MEETEKSEVELLRQQLALERKRLEEERQQLELEKKRQEKEKRQQQENLKQAAERKELDKEWKKLEEERKKLELDRIKQEMGSNSKLPSHLVCVVCGDTANGMHYRALTCEGCKIFFRRNSKRQELLQCSNTDQKGNCVMDVHKRRFCAFCRFKKCLDNGMQLGRVWDKDRCKTRKPMKNSKLATSQPPPNIKRDPDAAELLDSPSPSTSCDTTSTTPVPPISHVQLSAEQEALNRLVSNAFQTALNVFGSLPQQTQTNIGDLRMKLDETKEKLKQKSLSVVKDKTDSCTSSLKRVSSSTQKDKDKVKQTDLSDLLNLMNSTDGQNESDDTIINDAIHKHIMESILLELKSMIMFVKALPAFHELLCEDQASLVKETFVEYLTIKCAHYYDPEKKVFVSRVVPGDVFTLEDVSLGGFEDLMASTIQFSEKLNKMMLTPDELGILSALCILTSDRPVLSEDAKRKISFHNEKLADLLIASGQINHPDIPQFFPKVVTFLTELRNHSEYFLDRMMQLKLKGHALQPILGELFDM